MEDALVGRPGDRKHPPTSAAARPAARGAPRGSSRPSGRAASSRPALLARGAIGAPRRPRCPRGRRGRRRQSTPPGSRRPRPPTVARHRGRRPPPRRRRAAHRSPVDARRIRRSAFEPAERRPDRAHEVHSRGPSETRSSRRSADRAVGTALTPDQPGRPATVSAFWPQHTESARTTRSGFDETMNSGDSCGCASPGGSVGDVLQTEERIDPPDEGLRRRREEARVELGYTLAPEPAVLRFATIRAI